MTFGFLTFFPNLSTVLTFFFVLIYFASELKLGILLARRDIRSKALKGLNFENEFNFLRMEFSNRIIELSSVSFPPGLQVSMPCGRAPCSKVSEK